MNIEGMLKYQSLDRELNQLNEKFRTSDATVLYNRNMKLYKQTIEDAFRKYRQTYQTVRKAACGHRRIL